MNEATRNYNLSAFKGSKNVMRQNKNSPYKGIPSDKAQILYELEIRRKQANVLSSGFIGEKNLIYYCAFGPDYISLLEMSLKSISSVAPFDVLIITDSHTKKMICSLACISQHNILFHEVESPIDGVEASMKKLEIFDFKNINEYKKILFLDVDIICVGEISKLFLEEPDNFFHVKRSPILNANFSQMVGVYKSCTITHSLAFFSAADLKLLKTNDLEIFNAGQFFFYNTLSMQTHFGNIRWLVNVWPSVYFFEQSFMNHYFVYGELVKYDLLDEIVSITTVKPTVSCAKDLYEKQHSDGTTLIHFAGTPTDGKNKYIFILNYCKKHNIVCH